MLRGSHPVQGKYKHLIAFLLKLAVKLLLELGNSHVNSQQDMVNCAKEESMHFWQVRATMCSYESYQHF